MNIIQRKRISDELKGIARDLNHKYNTEQKTIEKLISMSKELVEDQPKEGDRTLIED